LADDGQPTAVALGETPGDRQTAAFRRLRPRANPVERLEDPLEIDGGDTGPVVDDFDHGVAVDHRMSCLLVGVETAYLPTAPDPTALEVDNGAARCVAADAPSLLLETGALERDLRDGCRLVFDPTRTWYATDRGGLAAGSVGASRQRAIGYQTAMVRYNAGSEDGDVTDRVRAIGVH
jgi:hypothetical protein